MPAINPAVLSLAAALQNTHLGNAGLQNHFAAPPNMMASSLALAANAVAAASTMSGGHSGVGLNNALVGLQGNGLAQAASQQGLSNLNVNPLLCNNQVGTSFYESP